MLKLTVNNNFYDVTSCYKTTLFNKATGTSSGSISDFTVINLSDIEGNNEEHVDISRTI